MNILLLIFALLSVEGRAASELTEYYRLPVTEVRSPVFQPSELKEIQSKLGIEIGQPLQPQELNARIRKIQQQGVLQGIFIYSEKKGRGLSLEITGSKIRKIRNISFENIDPDILQSARQGLKLEEGQSSDMREFSELRDRLK